MEDVVKLPIVAGYTKRIAVALPVAELVRWFQELMK
jgi:hypothetical protein